MSTIQFQDDWRSFGVGGDITEDGSFSNWKSSPKTNANKITPVMNDFNDFFSPSPRSSQPTCRPAATSLDKTLPKPCLTTSHMHTSLPSASAQPTNLWLGNSGSDTLLNTHCNHNQESINTSFDITEPTREDLGVSEEIEPLEIYIERELTQIAVVTSENRPMESLIDTVDHDTIQQSIDDLDLPKEVQPENATEQVQKFQASERKQSLDSLSCLESEQMSVQHPVSNPKEVQMDGLESQDQPILLECQDSIYEPTIADEPVQSIDSPTNSQTIESIENIEVPEESNEDDFGDFDDFDDFDDFEGFDDFGSIKEDDDFNCDDSPKVSVNKPPALRIDTTLGNTPLKAYTPPEDQIIFDNYNVFAF
ncbi:hypothetical protein CLU79DRAFT_719452 [Phycomyces nitens]|nr:hypothetical protein CLU79DRAFT_719452 [Phycomyces nitens]